MHELSLMTEVISHIEGIAKVEKFKRVVKLRLSVGEFSGVDPDCLTFCFSEAARGSVVEGAMLEVVRIATKIRCLVCQKENNVEDPAILICPECHGVETKMISGKEFKIMDLEVQD